MNTIKITNQELDLAILNSLKSGLNEQAKQVAYSALKDGITSGILNINCISEAVSQMKGVSKQDLNIQLS